MLKLVGQLIRLLIVVPIMTVGMGTIGWFGMTYYDVSLPLFSGRTLFTIMEMETRGDVIVGKQYTITAKNHLYVKRFQGMDKNSLREIGEPKHVLLPKIQTETLIDIVTTLEDQDNQSEKQTHYLSINIGLSKNCLIAVPEKQKNAELLVRTLIRYSHPDDESLH